MQISRFGMRVLVYANKTSNMLVRLVSVARSILDVKRQGGGGRGGGGGQRGRAIPECSDLTFSGISLQTNIANINKVV